MPLDVFSRVKDGDLNIINQNSNHCNIKFSCKKNDNKYVINRLWNKETTNEIIFTDLRTKVNVISVTGVRLDIPIRNIHTIGILKLLLEYYRNKSVSVRFQYQIYNEKVYDI